MKNYQASYGCEVFVGSGGTEKNFKTREGSQQTLLAGVVDQAKRDRSGKDNPYKHFPDWDQAILICDWEHDIQFRNISTNLHSHNKYNLPGNQIVNSAMKNDVKLVRQFCNVKLIDYEASGSIQVAESRKNNLNIFVDKYDIDRYEYYIYLALKFVRYFAPNFDKEPKPKIKVGDKLYAEFDSEATVLDSEYISVEKFKIGNKWASKSAKAGFQKVSRNFACEYIRQQNGRKRAMSANTFWKVIKDNKMQQIKDFEFE